MLVVLGVEMVCGLERRREVSEEKVRLEVVPVPPTMNERVRGDTLSKGDAQDLLHVGGLLLDRLPGEPVQELCKDRVAAGAEDAVQQFEHLEVQVVEELLAGLLHTNQNGGEAGDLVPLLGGACNGYMVS